MNVCAGITIIRLDWPTVPTYADTTSISGQSLHGRLNAAKGLERWREIRRSTSEMRWDKLNFRILGLEVRPTSMNVLRRMPMPTSTYPDEGFYTTVNLSMPPLRRV